MGHVVHKNDSNIILGDFIPNQSYLVTPNDQWRIGQEHVNSGVYPIKEVSTTIKQLLLERVLQLNKVYLTFETCNSYFHKFNNDEEVKDDRL